MGIKRETEATFMATVLAYARLRGWVCYHTHDSRRSAAGFPDLVLCRSGRLIFAELKSARGKLRPAQELWLDELRTVPLHEVYVWVPSDWPRIEEVLK